MTVVIVYYLCHLRFRISVDQGYLIGWLSCMKIVLRSRLPVTAALVIYRHVSLAQISATHLLLAVFRRKSGVIRVFVLEILNSRRFEFG